MGRILSFVSGTIVGAIIVLNVDEIYIRSIRNNLVKPVKSEIYKEKFDLANVIKISAKGIKNTYNDIWG